MTGATQTERVLSLLRSRGPAGLTPLDALDLVGSFRLAARIHDAKERIGDDEEIITESVTANGATFARYVLRKRPTPGVVQPPLWTDLL